MKRFLLSTAIAIAATTVAVPAAWADSHATTGASVHGELFMPALDAGTVTASDLIGMRVYVSEAVDPDMMEVAGINDGWNDVGEIHDVVLSRDGQVRAVLVDVGGFLGMGEHTVAVDMGSLRFVGDSSTDDPDDFFLVVQATAAQLEAAPAWDRETRQYLEPDTMHASAMTREGYTSLAYDQVTAEDVTGAPVYDGNDEWIGEVSELIVNTDGKLEQAIVDVGGFLGIGEKPVALSMDQLEILRETDGDDIRVYTPMTKEQLEALPSWNQ